MSKYDCKQCGQDMRLPPINFQRMNWIIGIVSKLIDVDKKWVISRLSSDFFKKRNKYK